ncbi:hypothetical protein [Maribacter cobaltidurans]|uniref:Uncharacterized protein n=1 Tax=Maribacter cobaltidurans TaxID=1178778 RepID=A0A223V1C2_9FLAO|nr:hypothetical protein [Maribacter cobaltidurans]ASV29132.1 hypothetical protein CJ263_02210 [Maribacter cobaltidurans]GGD71640.1 hypothetical protein GCM10011412_06550 [Maribacter cobaltidurans]
MSKTYRKLILVLFFISYNSFGNLRECEYAEANIDFAKSQTEKALEKPDVNLLKYHVYKAISAIQKTEKKLSNCGCEYAQEHLGQSLESLKLATRQEELFKAKDLLLKSLESIMNGLKALSEHDYHEEQKREALAKADSKNSSISNEGGNSEDAINPIYKEIDQSLEKYRNSLNKVVETVNCKEASNFAENIIEQCENQLLVENLTEGKKYYYLRTKEITTNALEKLRDCYVIK